MRYHWFLTILSIILCGHSSAQNNLVPNGGFDTYLNCPSEAHGNLMDYCLNEWNSPTIGSTDYFNQCSDYSYFPPNGAFYGPQSPHSGDGFIGMYYFALGQPEGRDYAQVELRRPLHAGVRYKVSFYANLADMSRYAVSSLGAYLSEDAISLNEYWLLDVVPQILNPPGNIITDTIGWVLVTDTFASRSGGGERFLTIGNFNYAAVSDTLLYNPTGDLNYSFAYYYIDDVSVVALDSVPSGVGIEKMEEWSFSVYPNPATDVVRFRVLDPSASRKNGTGSFSVGMTLRVLDAVGREVKALLILPERDENGSIDVSTLPQGIYFLELTDGQGRKTVRKFVKG